MSSKITIAIDGFSSTGKSTIAKELAKKLNYTYVDTGAMYRAVTLFAIENGIIKETLNKGKLIENLPEIKLSFQGKDICLNGENVERKIRTLEVADWVSEVATISEVRSLLVEQQQAFGVNGGVVMDGRDIGTVVFPNAELKLFITADAEIRAKRRYDEMISKGENPSFEDVLKNIETRDRIDMNRKDSPLKKAEDAIEIDNSNLTPKEQFEKIYQLVADRIG
ncbi:MAG: (d)CMP kinase [Flavobacteriaceae bacterium]|nr:(d)CMP kinase [Flavobacteriaceae bacterium]